MRYLSTSIWPIKHYTCLFDLFVIDEFAPLEQLVHIRLRAHRVVLN